MNKKFYFEPEMEEVLLNAGMALLAESGDVDIDDDDDSAPTSNTPI